MKNGAWRKLRRGEEISLESVFTFLRRPIWYEVCQNRTSHRPGDTDPLQDITVQHRILIPLGFNVVLPVISSAVFLLVGSFLITATFGSSE